MKKAGTLFLMLALLLRFTPVCRAEQEITLVSLGDSIARGYGCQPEEAYGSLLADYIGGLVMPAPFQVRYVNYGTDGDTAADLLEKLTGREDVRASVRAADILTISVGGNDLIHQLSDLMPAQGDSVIGNVAKLLTALGQGLSESRSLEVFQQFRNDMEAILQLLDTLSPQALVILTTIPNPTSDAAVGPLIDRYLERFNDYIRSGCGRTRGIIPAVADCSRAFASYTGEEALTFAHIDWSDLRTLSLDPHPTPAGHQVMAQTHIPLLEDRLVEIRTAWLKTDLPERQEESRASLLRRLLPPMALLAAVFLLWALLPRRRHI